MLRICTLPDKNLQIFTHLPSRGGSRFALLRTGNPSPTARQTGIGKLPDKRGVVGDAPYNLIKIRELADILIVLQIINNGKSLSFVPKTIDCAMAQSIVL